MADNALETVCRDCGRPLSFHAGETQPARCESCFDGLLRVRDRDFLSSYHELGVASRRVVAETCLRALVTESPPHRKVLAMNIMEQYVLAAGDMIGLYYALKHRGQRPVMRAFLDFKLDRATALSFFQEVAAKAPAELLEDLALPMPDAIAQRWPALSKSDARDLRRAMTQMLGDFRRTSEMGEGVAMALGQAAGERRGGASLIKQSTWLDGVELRPDQVASIGLDHRRRTINLTAISVDEARLQNIISAIGAMTNISSTLIYATLTSMQEEERDVKGSPRRG
jgi:hypothetical protein